MKKKKKKKKKTKTSSEWEHLLSVQKIFQSHFPECILVGGTVAAIYVGHRVSVDADHVHPELKTRFSEILKAVEREAGWKTNRIEPPVLILGNFQGIRTGIRQLKRTQPLETKKIRGLKIPTEDEILRIKAYLIVKRNATRDYVDFVALFDHLGVTHSLKALASFDELYPQEEGISITQQLSLQLADPKPWDLSKTELSHYKNLKEPYTNWKEIKRRSLAAGRKILEKLFRET
jgi:hypothetical protein